MCYSIYPDPCFFIPVLGVEPRASRMLGTLWLSYTPSVASVVCTLASIEFLNNVNLY